jgi:segregation and condensation protein A
VLTGIPQLESRSDDGLEILVQMAQNRQIDPWNVDIGKVAEQYLIAVSDMQTSDLKLTGKTLLYLAILLRMKSDLLNGHWLWEEPEPEDNEPVWELDRSHILSLKKINPFKSRVVSLDEALQRRTSIKQQRIRRVTLEDLITELKKVEAMEHERAYHEKVKRIDNRRVRDFSTLTADDIVDLAHEEFVEDNVDRLSSILELHFLENPSMTMTELREISGLDAIETYLALLTLTSRSQINLNQDDFYGTIHITPDTEEVTLTPVADEAQG